MANSFANSAPEGVVDKNSFSGFNILNNAIANELQSSFTPPMLSGSELISSIAFPSSIRSGQTATATSVPTFNDVFA